ncbi:MAG: MFS transporter [Proteobacteria bacterium]|nr:MFS transporter [Pseudomonadota bacterium]MBI3497568.1 MFS transporter [Pseudomonadota bacterium]
MAALLSLAGPDTPVPNLLRLLGPLLASVLLMQLATGLFGTLAPLTMSLAGFSTETVGTIGSAFYLGLLAGCIIGGPLIERVGHIRTFAGFAAISAAAPLALPVFLDPWAWAGLRAICGLAIAVQSVAVESWLSASSNDENRGRVFAIYMFLAYLATAGSQFLLTLDDPRSGHLFSLVAGFSALCLVPIALARSANPALPEHAPFGIAELYRLSPLGFIGCVASGLLQGALYSLGPIFAASSGLGLAQVSTFMSATVIGALLLQLPIGRFSDRIDRRVMLLAVAAGTAFAAAAIVLVAARMPAALMVAALLFGGFAATIYPVSVAHANDFLQPKDRVAASAGLLFAYSAGASLGPFLASLAMGRIGPAGLYMFLGTVALGLAGFVLWRMRQRPTVDAAAKGRFAWLSSHSTSGANPTGATPQASSDP